jgi:putative SOS response-associated peptidase YedK
MPSASPALELMTAASRRSPDFGTKRAERLKSCTKFVTEPNNFVAQIHGRRPVILDVKDFQQWEQGDVKDAAALMTPAPEGLLVKRAVSK